MVDTHIDTQEPIDSVSTNDDESEHLAPSLTARRSTRKKAPRLDLPTEVPPPASGKAALKKTLEESLGEWLKKLHFRVFTDRIPRHENTGELLTASVVEQTHLVEYYSWEFSGVRDFSLPTISDPAQAFSSTPTFLARPPLDALPTVVMEKEIIKSIISMGHRLEYQSISIPEDWKIPYSVPYTGTESKEDQEAHRENRELNRKHLVEVLQGLSGIEWTGRDFFKNIEEFTLPNVTLNESYFLDNFLSLYSVLVSPGSSKRPRKESTVVVNVSSKIVGLCRSPITITEEDVILPFPRPLGTFGSPAKLDLAMIMTLEEDWGMGITPICFGGETKTGKTKSENTPAQLAWGLHPSINLLILYHLHTRKSTADPFPPWLYIFGIVQDERGIDIYAHYPRMVFATESDSKISGGPSVSYPHWGYTSLLVTTTHRRCFRKGGGHRVALLSALLAIQAHAHHLTLQFRKWKPSPEELLDLRECAKMIPPVAASEPPSPLSSSSSRPWNLSSKRSSASPPPLSHRGNSQNQRLYFERRLALGSLGNLIESAEEDPTPTASSEE